ncbi:hypothetical protein cypCar_00032544 [Cyprinus carpio]|nr:hypothetical protein cypCar_00032544 [Cyprinus carpio]
MTKLTPLHFIPPGPEMSPIGSIKQVKESKIMEFFQDFLLELEDTQPEDAAGRRKLVCAKIMQWRLASSHALLVFRKEKFNIVLKFDHCCLQHMPNHNCVLPNCQCLPTNTITFPVVHMVELQSFKTLMQTAVTYGQALTECNVYQSISL